jgi:NitT/TauT family transport system substrate-binding protein
MIATKQALSGRLRLGAVMLSLLLFTSSGTAGVRAADLQHLRVSMAAQTTLYAPYLVAIEKGYYADEGLALDVTIASGGVATPALLSGSLDISTSNPSVLSPALRGAPLKILYTMANRSQYELWSTSPDIKSVKDLKGKQVGIIARGDSFEISMKLALQKLGLPLDYVGYTPLGSAGTLTATLISGALPAVMTTDTDAEVARDAGALARSHLLYDMHKELPMPYSGIAVTEQFLQTHRDALHGFLRATMKAVRYIRKYKAQTIAIVEKYSKVTDPRIADFDYYSAVSILTKDGTIAEDVLKSDLAVRASLIELTPGQIPPIGKIYDYSIVRQANAELDAQRWQPAP